MMEKNWDGYMLSEYEGPRMDEPGFVSEQIRRQHVMEDASCRNYPAHYSNGCVQAAQAPIYPQFKASDCMTSHAIYHFKGRYFDLLCFHISKSCYPCPSPETPVLPVLYLDGIKLANQFRNYLFLL